MHVQIFLAGHMPAVAFYTLAAVEAVGMSVSLAKVAGVLDSSRVGDSAGDSIWKAYLDFPNKDGTSHLHKL